MAISVPTVLINGWDTDNQNPYNTNETATGNPDPKTVVLTAGRLYVLIFHHYRTAATTATNVVHDPDGTPLNFNIVNIGGQLARRISYDGAGHRTGEVWWVIPTTTTADALIRITLANTPSACGWTLLEYASGFDSTNPWVQFVGANGTGGTSSLVTMGTYGATDNATLFVTFLGTGTGAPNETMSATEGRTQVAVNNETERAEHGVYYQIPHGGDTTLTASWVNAEDWGALGFEIKAASTANTVNVLAAGIANAQGAATLAVLRQIKVAGIAISIAFAQSSVLKSMKANGVAEASSASKIAVLRNMRGSGIAFGAGLAKQGRLLSIQASGAAFAFGSVKSSTLRSMRASGLARSDGVSRLGALRGLTASGLAFSFSASKIAAFRGMKASGLGASFTTGQLGRIRPIQASGAAFGFGSSLVTIVVGGVPRQMLASGLGFSIGVSKLAALRNMRASGLAAEASSGKVSSIIRGMKASGLGLATGESKVGVKRGLKASGLGLGFGSSHTTIVAPGVVLISASGLGLSVSSAKTAVLRGLKAEGVAEGYGSALVTIFAGGGPKQLLASGMGIAVGLAKLGVIRLSCFPVSYECVISDVAAVTDEAPGAQVEYDCLSPQVVLSCDDSLCINICEPQSAPLMMKALGVAMGYGEAHFDLGTPTLLHLEFLDQPQDGAPNADLFPPPSVVIMDAGENVITDFVGNATVSLIVLSTTGPNAPHWVLTGDLTTAFGDIDPGIAYWLNIQVSGDDIPFVDGMFCKLEATCPGVTGTISDTFFIGGGPT